MKRSPRLRRTLLAATAVTALTGVFAAGVLVGGAEPDARPDAPPLSQGPFRLASTALAPTPTCDELLESYQARALPLVGPWGWEGVMELAVPAAGAEVGDTAARLPAAATPRAATSSETGTNVQEAGVDEPDLAKTDGSLLVRVDGSTLVVHDVTGATPVELSRLRLPGVVDPQILLVGDTVVAVGARVPDPDEWAVGSSVVTVDLGDPKAPEVGELAAYDAGLVTARQHGDVVRVVLRTDLPQLDFRHPGGRLGERGARLRNQELVRRTTLADWLPQVDGELAVDCADVAVPDDEEAVLGTVTTVAFTAAAPTRRTSVAVATATDLAYFSTDRLHLATQASGWWGLSEVMGRTAIPRGAGGTHLYSFALDGTDTTFVAAGGVDGAIRDRWSMDAVDGVLRVAVGPTMETGNFNSVITLTEEDGALVETGRLDELGVGEEIKSVRWFDGLAFVVTFRTVDPLYAVDLTDPARPRLLGKLKIPGFSQYLHPLGPNRLLGIGQDADVRDGGLRGAQAALFGVTDLTAPKRLDTVTYPRESVAQAGHDPRQFTWLPEQRVALTVISKGWEGRTGWLSIIKPRGHRLTETRTEVEYGRDVDRVRMLPLPEGRVALVTGDDVTFVDVD
ncbi:beta-propeller domain-containing protein [Nocardioides daphniae]|uniref:Benzoate transporter n=1 Tax=Nocardioides daphniae TaxID=402297 RepID=A0A4P7UD10_9ACTN|nr:beta-propeller domain-containing protein [Nocardioides daphniae]QCC78132.1 hypothetical protein E2C04_14780 [Nocardioides daphniae]GGD21600.1 hypothetical protein GCM10007231_21040 [Nocardioides daphniae]